MLKLHHPPNSTTTPHDQIEFMNAGVSLVVFVNLIN